MVHSDVSTLFISHSSADNAAAEELKRELLEHEYESVFLDFDRQGGGIQAGADWERTLYTRLRACRAVVALVSDNYLGSQWCFAEVALARMEGKELFVLQIDPWSGKMQMPSILTQDQYVDLRTNREQGYEYLLDGFEAKGIVPAKARRWNLAKPPYPGLRAFREEDAPIFFGRDDEIRAGAELLNQVRRQGHPRLVMVLGSSGSGKSSLVRAGIVPWLKGDPTKQWLVVNPFRPGPRPAEALAVRFSESFAEAGERLSWRKVLRRLGTAGDDVVAPAEGQPTPTPADAAGAAPAHDRLLEALSAMEAELTAADIEVARSVRRLKELLGRQAKAPHLAPDAPPAAFQSPLVWIASDLRNTAGRPNAAVVLVIDQFEELLDPREEASRFLALLRMALEEEHSPLLVIGTMRSDYLGVFQRSSPLLGVGFKSLSVGPMSREGMRRIIKEPARLGQIKLQDGLAEKLLHDTQTSDALPLLAFTLRMMWEDHHEKRLFEIEDYTRFGGLQGAIGKVADETFEAALDRYRDAGSRHELERELRDAFLRMARPAAEGSGWTRQPVAWDKLGATARKALEEPFIDRQRLLIKRPDGTVEVAHEALFRSWRRLESWLEENAESMQLREEIQTGARKWETAGTAEDKEPYLFSGSRLARARELRDSGVLPLEKLDEEFLEASDRAERAEAEAKDARRRKQLRVAWAVVGLVLVVLAAAIWQWVRAQQAALQATVGRLAAQAQISLATRPDLGLLLAVEATLLDDTAEAQSSLLTAVQLEPRLEKILRHPEGVSAMAISRDGQTLATGGAEGRIRLWSATTGELLDEASDGDGEIKSLAFDRDAKLLASGGTDSEVRLWKLGDPSAPVLSQLGSLPRAAHTYENQLWDIEALAFTTDGRHLVSCDQKGVVLSTWDAKGSVSQLAKTELSGGCLAAAFQDSDPSQVLLAGYDHAATWRVGDPAAQGRAREGDPAGESAQLRINLDDVWTIAFTDDGRSMASGHEGRVDVWDLSKWEVIPWRSNQNLGFTVSSLGFVSGSSYPAIGDVDGTVHKGRESPEELVLEPVLIGSHRDRVTGLAGSQDGDRLISASLDGSVRFWNLQRWDDTGFEFQPLAAARVLISSTAAISPDFRLADKAQLKEEIRIRDLESESASVKTLQARMRTDSLVFRSRDGSLLATRSRDSDGSRSWYLLGPTTEDPPKQWTEGNEKDVKLLTFAHEADLLVSAGEKDGKKDRILKWEARTGDFLEDLGQHVAVERLAVSPGGHVVASGDANGSIRLWGGANAGELGIHPGLRSLAFSPDGSRLASSGGDTVELWDVDEKRKLHSLRARDGEDLAQVVFDPVDGSRLAAVDEKRAVHLWDGRTGQPIGRLLRGAKGNRIAFSPDGARLAVWGRRSLTIFHASLPYWRRRACSVASRNLTAVEWDQFRPGVDYLCTCPDLPPGEGTGLESCPPRAAASFGS